MTEPLVTQEDAQYFSHLYGRYKNFMYYIAQQYTKNEEDCEDIVQEAVIRLLRNLGSIKSLNEHKIRSYISLTIKAVYLDYLYYENRLALVHFEDESVQGLLENDSCFFSFLPDFQSKFEIERLKLSLSERDWVVLEGKYILGYSQEEISKIIHVAPDSVRTIIVRAKKKAREILLTGIT